MERSLDFEPSIEAQEETDPYEPRSEAERKVATNGATQALMVQDACNLSGVTHSLSRFMEAMAPHAFGQPGRGTDWLNHHPVAVLFCDKMTDLAGRSPRRFSDAYDWCEKHKEKA